MGGWDQNGSKDISYVDVEWIQLARDTVRWRILVNTVINLRVLPPRN
jgi:hypothetical protein